MATSGFAQQEVRGRVVDPDATPVVGATVSVEGTRLVVETGAQGQFTIPALELGRYVLRVTRIGFEPARETITIGANAAQIRVTIVPRAVELGGLTIIGSDAELEEIRARLREIPGSVVLIEPSEIRGTRQANFQDLLRFTPGVFAQPRFGAADETQLSVRGSGLRNNFHLRGVNVLINGMPYRNADGFTDFESIELLTVESAQVYKAANAFRFGGATLGGAINLETKTGYTATPLTVFAEGGQNGYLKAQLASGDVRGPLDYYVSFARTQVDGFRVFSGQERNRVNAHAGYVLSPTVDLRAFYLFADVQEDLPGSLTLEEFEQDREMANANNVSNVYGRDYRLHHFGAQLRLQPGPSQRLDIAPYTQYRDIVHPIFRVIDQISRDVGVEARYQNDATLGDMTQSFVLGAQLATGNIDNKHYANEAGESGELQKDQRDEANTLALFAEEGIRVTSGLSVIGGLRYSRADRIAEDHFLSDGDQSDKREFEAWLPKLGLLIETDAGTQIYANATRAYEPPLIFELNSLTIPGFIELEAQDAWQFEVGTRGQTAGIGWDVALYDIEIDDEIVNVNVQPFPNAPFTVPTYRNVPSSRHRGAEAGIVTPLFSNLITSANGGDAATLRLAYTFSDFTFVEDDDYEGNRLPGAPQHALQAELAYLHPSGLSLRPNLEWIGGDYFADSANEVANDGWFTFGARAEYTLAHLGATLFVEARNLTDEVYSPAVTVDDSNGRHFLPADGRSLYAGFRWHH